MKKQKSMIFLTLVIFISTASASLGDITSSSFDTVSDGAYTEGDHAGIDEKRGLYLGADGYNDNLRIGDFSSIGSSVSYSVNNLNGDVQDIDVSDSDSSHYFISSDDGNLVKWDYQKSDTVAVKFLSEATGSSVEVKDGRVFFANSERQSVFDTDLGLVADLSNKNQDVVPIKVSDKFIFVGGPSTSIYSRDDYSLVDSISEASTSIAVSNFYDKVAVVKDGQNVEIYDYSNGKFKKEYTSDFKSATYVGGAAACDDHIFAFYTSGQELKTFDVENETVIDSEPSPAENINGMECGYSEPDNSFYAVLRDNSEGFDVFEIDGQKFKKPKSDSICDIRGSNSECVSNRTHSVAGEEINIDSVFISRQSSLFTSFNGQAGISISNRSIISGTWKGEFNLSSNQGTTIGAGASLRPRDGDIIVD